MEKHGFISVVAILLFVPVVYGATITVDDDGPADFNSIQAAIDDANDSDEIEVRPGTYNEAINFNGKAIRLYSSGGRDVTTIDGTGNYHVVQCVNGEDANTILEGFTITGGNANGSSPHNCGGGMLNESSSPTVTNCTFSGNNAVNDGGGMYNLNSSPTVTNCTFSNNSASYGAGMYNHSNSSPTVTDCNLSANDAVNGGGGMVNNSNSSPMITSCTLTGNKATNTDGGGMWNGNGSNPKVTDCTFSGNDAGRYGGGIYNTDCNPTVVNCFFSQNTAGINGGGIANYTSSDPDVYNCTFSSNEAGVNGGGMDNNNSNPYVANCTFSSNNAITGLGGGISNNISNHTVVNCLFLKNSAGDKGGGICNNNASTTVSNCTFRQNTAASYGGGMFNNNGSLAKVTNCIFNKNIAQGASGGGIANYTNSHSIITNCTFSSNTTGAAGGGIRNYNSNPTVKNCIIWDNNPDEISNDTSAPTVQYCDVKGGYGGTGNINADPCFVDADANDFRLLSESPCVDNGNTGAVPADTADLDGDGDTTEPIPFDLYGNPRIWNDIVDMGALEYGELRVHNVTQNTSYISIQKAIDDANDGDEIKVDPGTYKEETIDFKGRAIRLYSTDGPNYTIIDGTGNYHVVQCISSEGPDTILEGFTLTGGTAAYGSSPDNCGGGMYNSSSSPTVTNCTFRSNLASGIGGGMYNETASPTVTNCIFSGNSAGYGSGMGNYQGSNPTVTDCTFSGNSGYMGGGMWNGNGSNPTVTDCIFLSNAASLHGGGMHNEHTDPKVTNCIFSGNTASAHGGGMMNNYGSVSYTANCVFIGNTANEWGGGMCNVACSPYFINCTFRGNTASSGGAIYSYGSYTNIQNCILWANGVDEIDYSYGTMFVTYSDVQGGYFGTGNIDVNPQFVDPWNGDFRPKAPDCVDAGNNANVPPGVTMDIRGKPRFVDDPNIPDTGSGTPPIVDMGAYERQPDDIFRTITVDDDGPADFNTIQAAIDDANSGDEIEVAPGIYYESINFKGKAVWLYSIGGPAVTTIDGTGHYHVVKCVSGESPSTILEGFIITGGNANGAGIDKYGGGLYNNGSPTVTNCIFRSNTAGYGGGIFNEPNSAARLLVSYDFENIDPDQGVDVNAPPSFVDAEIVTATNLSIVQGSGVALLNGFARDGVVVGPSQQMSFQQGIANYTHVEPELYNFFEFSVAAVNSPVEIASISFWTGHNYPSGADHEGIIEYRDSNDLLLGSNTFLIQYGLGAAPVSIVPATTLVVGTQPVFFRIRFNKEIYGPHSWTTQLRIDDVELKVATGLGGAMYSSVCKPTVTNCTFSGNLAEHGGGMFNSQNSYPIVTNCTFISNTALSATYGGGGMFNYSSDPVATNCTFINNTALSASYGGGGMFNKSSNPAVINCTFSGNWANHGGGIYSYHNSSPTVTNCILWENTAAWDPEIYGSCTVTYSNVKGGYSGAGNIAADPLFVLSGEPHLGFGSPCIDSGTNTPMAGLPATDPDGTERILDGDDDDKETVDMGAYEFNPDTLSPPCMVVWPPLFEFIAYGGQTPEPELLDIKNVAGGTLNWSIEANCSWLELNRTSGQSSGETDNVVLDPNISDLSPGKYLCTLIITDPNAINSPQIVFVVLNVGCVREVPTATYPTIGSAIEDSNDGDIIMVDNGTYYEYDLDFGGRAIMVRSENGPENCIIDCNNFGRGFYFHNGETQDSTLDGFTIQDGNSSAAPGDDRGGGIYIYTASPTIRNCDFNSCESSSEGGAIYAIGSIAIINNCQFNNNSALYGGGMYNYAAGPKVNNCTFTGNSATVDGGGMLNWESSPKVTNCIFTGNTSIEGGGMSNYWDGSPIVTNCTFSENEATNGGGMYSMLLSNPMVTNCVFSDNTASGWGGGMWNSEYSSPTLINCTFTNNTANIGGGMLNVDYGTPILTNCTFLGNTATNGGGMYNKYVEGGSLTNCTFSNNTATNGGGIYNSDSWISSPTVTNCIFWDNNQDEIWNNTSTLIVTYSDVNGGTGQPWFGAGCIDADPFFVNVGASDLRLQVTSPCIDIGRSIAGIHCDVRGSVRPIDISAEGDNLINNNFDMGAYEYSRYYSGTEDGNVPAFRDVEMPSYCLVEEAVEIKWKNHPGFPDDDIRITDPKAYQVNLVLVSEDYTRQITLNDEPITVPSTTPAPDIPYSHEYTFKAIHGGRWYLRIELSEDRNQYVESSRTFLIGLREPKLFEIGRQITPPADADLTIDPKIEEGREDYFFWSEYARRLYAVGPIAAVVEWTDTRGDPLPVLVGNVWPYEMQIHVADSPDVELLPEGSQFSFVEIRYADNDAVVSSSQFSATSEGRCVLMYGDNTNYEFVPQFEVVRTVLWNNPEYLEEAEWPIGTEVTEPKHNNDCGSGHIYWEISPYDADIYDRDTRNGQIFAVNLDDPCSEADDLIVFWYEKGIYGADWPYLPMRYDPKWPTPQEGLEKIVIASCLGSDVYDQNALDGTHRNVQIYNQPDPALPGRNPNEEHAAFFLSNQNHTYQAVYALRNDLNRTAWGDPDYNYTSEPYVLLKYQDTDNTWHYRIFKVLIEEGEYVLRYAAEAGWLMQPPYPLIKILPGCDGFSYADMPGPWWTDYNSKIWARHAGPNEMETATGTIRWFYPLLGGFYYDFDQDGVQDEPVGTCVPWLDLHDSNSGVPIAVTYDVFWPSPVPELQVGETLMKPKRGLPDITNQCGVEIIYDEPNDVYGIAGAVKLIEPLSEHRVDLLSLPSQIKVSNKGGIKIFDDLPFHLRTRFYYDPLNKKLVFRGYFDDTVVGEPILLLNVISDREKEELRSLPGANSTFEEKVDELYQLTQEAMKQNQTKLIGGPKALSAGTAGAEGFVTLVFADDNDCSPLPVSVEVIKVVCGPYRGEIKVIESDNVFDERITFRHSGDFGGRPEGRLFEWMYSYSPDKPNDPNLDLLEDDWQVWPVDPCDGNAVLEVTVGGPGLIAVQDLWFSCRYYDETCGEWSLWTKPQLHESWLKRVNRQVNLFDQRFKDFHESEINTLVSMIGQIGRRYEGDVALTADPENINSMGMLELYETLFRRAAEFSLDQGINDPLANRTLLFASSRLATLYTLLGNEAYADALDPTIGFTTEGVDYGAMAPVIHCFQNQTDSLLSEELSLLRGLESDPYPQPLYNRLVWNFTSGDGEVAYASNYVITDMDNDGDIDEYDAQIMYPQGHGDAWGHYLMALKTYYRLLVHPDYIWVPQPEYVLVAGTPVEVDYFDERQFAKIAAAKAKAGAEIVDLTYRQRFDEDPENQWQGYKDTDSSRAWGVDGWAARAGQGAYFDWIVANSLLPDEDTDANHIGLQKVDRTTVIETRDIASSFNEIQAKLDMADLGLNPLGVAKDAIPFDINPFELVDAHGQPAGRTHFEQIYDRAFTALNNALTAFNFANQSTQLLRRQQDSLEDFTYNVEQRELDFRNRMIEIYGYPYDDDIGPTGTYPEGYDGPDLYHYMYVGPSELMSSSSPEPIEFTVTFREPRVDSEGALSYESKDVVFYLSPDGLGLIKPASWTGSRRAPGELQMARSDLLQAKANFDRALLDYGNLLEQIEDQADILQAQYDLNVDELYILNKTHNKQESLNLEIRVARGLELMFRGLGRRAVILADAMAEFIPTNVTAWGGDVGAPGRGAIKFLGSSINEMFTTFADLASMGELTAQQAKERAQSLSNIELTAARQEFAELQQLKQLEQLVRTEASQRLGLFTLAETMQQASGRYLAALARGIRIYEDLTRFRKQTASNIQHYRYKDMTFRVFRHDALQKYRAQFDLATRYAYLAAKAYDYETALLDDYSEAGQHFLNRIVRQRSIGQINQNVLVPGEGLAGVLAELNQNFDVFKTMMGFNNPQIETTWFSLRKEHFRIAQYAASNSDWQKELDKYYVDDLWDLPEFRRYCKPFDTEGVALPAIVIPFQTNITNGLNFFGWPGGADPFYAPENFVTKIRSVGIWFSNYDTSIMSPTPRVYLVPVGQDVVRADIGEIRSWQVIEQSIPLPFTIGEYELANNFEWIPMNDSVPGPLAEIRRYTRFRAYPDGGFNPSEMTYDSRLIGRSVWNTRWLLIIPGHSLYLSDPWEGMERFLFGAPIPGGNGDRTGNGVTDIKLFFKTYAYPGY